MSTDMNRLCVLMAITILLQTPAAADLGIPEFEAVYKVRVSVARGEMRLDFERRDGALVYHSELEPTGFVSLLKRGMLAETSRFVYTDGRLWPLEYTLVDTISKNRDGHYVFDWEEHEVTGSSRGETVEADLAGHVVDRLLLQLALMSDLAHGREIDSYTIFDRAEAKPYAVALTDAGTIQTRAGTFTTVEVSYTSEDGDKSIVLQCAPELHYLPVRIEQHENGEIKSTAELVEYEFAAAAN